MGDGSLKFNLLSFFLEPKSDFEKRQEMAKLHRRRYESFRLNSGDETTKNSEDESFLKKIKKKIGFSPNIIEDSGNNNDVDYELDNEDSDEERNDQPAPTIKTRSMSDIKRNFQLGDIIDFVHKGIDTIIDDDVTKRFTTEGLEIELKKIIQNFFKSVFFCE